ncbi:hypothetical protein [Lentzea flaviverrucosa]|uniref:hypothetical protein n=1 Tax=Lentzea flaviverrucosa TaxID=200379 RepID=UPI0014769F54|nr:hypothetical protein [Lentzea flaviverrucosa]
MAEDLRHKSKGGGVLLGVEEPELWSVSPPMTGSCRVSETGCLVVDARIRVTPGRPARS